MKLQQRYGQNALNEMFSQRLNYERHLKKLEQVNSNRKSYLVQSDRINKLQSLKARKHNTFIKSMIDRNNDIQKSNNKIFQRLSETKDMLPISHRLPVPRKMMFSEVNPFRKKMIEDTQRQNNRIGLKLRSLVSSINTKKIQEDYMVMKQIRNRISRYESTPNSQKRLPKSQKYLNFSISRSNRSVKSAKNSRIDGQSSDGGTAFVGQPSVPLRTALSGQNRSMDQKPRTVASFYRRQDIIKTRQAYNIPQNQYRSRLKTADRSNLLKMNMTAGTRNLSPHTDKLYQKSQNLFPTEIPHNLRRSHQI